MLRFVDNPEEEESPWIVVVWCSGNFPSNYSRKANCRRLFKITSEDSDLFFYKGFDERCEEKKMEFIKIFLIS